MPKYARFDSTAPRPAPVLGWYDTDLIPYPELPDSADMLELTDDQWAARIGRSWSVDTHGLVRRSPPCAQSHLMLSLALTLRAFAYACDETAAGRDAGLSNHVFML